MFKVKEELRVKHGPLASDASYGNNGAFVIPHPKIKDYCFMTIAADGMGFEHVSVTLFTKKRTVDRCPTWDEMCFIKDLFWDLEDCVMQIHPPKTEYVNNHQYCLHLWKPIGKEIPLPDSIMVGAKSEQTV